MAATTDSPTDLSYLPFRPRSIRPTLRLDARPCRCGTRHELTDPLLGTLLSPATYDYAGTVHFNVHAGALWSRFTAYLRREIATRLGLT